MSRDLVGENRQRAETLQGLRRAGAKQSPISVRFRVRAHFGGLRFSYLEPFLLKLRVIRRRVARSREASAFCCASKSFGALFGYGVSITFGNTDVKGKIWLPKKFTSRLHCGIFTSEKKNNVSGAYGRKAVQVQILSRAVSGSSTVGPIFDGRRAGI